MLTAVARRPGVADLVADGPRTGDDLEAGPRGPAAGAPAQGWVRRAAAATTAVTERPATCTCEPVRALAAHRVHAAAAILLALHDGRLTGARRR